MFGSRSRAVEGRGAERLRLVAHDRGYSEGKSLFLNRSDIENQLKVELR